jgi:hypothetical protein
LQVRLLLRVDALNHLLQVGAQGFEGLLEFGVGALLRLACAVVVAVVVAALVALASRLLADALGVLDGLQADGFRFGADGFEVNGQLLRPLRRVFGERRLCAWARRGSGRGRNGRRQFGQPCWDGRARLMHCVFQRRERRSHVR